MKKKLKLLSTLLGLILGSGVTAQTVDCFIIDNPTANGIDVYVIARGGSFLTQQWNDMTVTLSIPATSATNLGNPVSFAFGNPRPGNVDPSANDNTYTFKGWNLAKQPTNIGTAPSHSNPTKKYYRYAYAGSVNTFETDLFGLGQDATLPENTPVFMMRIPKNGNDFSTVEVYQNSFINTDVDVDNANGEYYIEINNLEFSGNVYKEDIIHFNNRLNQPPVTPQPLIWRGGTDATNEPNLTDVARNLTIYNGPAIKTMIGAVNNTRFIDQTKIIIQPNAGFQTTTVTNSTGGNDSILVKADATGYGQYIGPSIRGSIEQYVDTTEGWRNLSFPVAPSSTANNALFFGGAPISFNTASTSYLGTTAPNACGAFGAWINTVNVYEFLGAAGVAGPEGDHEWYGASDMNVGGNKGYSIFLGGSFFPTNGIISVKGILQDEAVADYNYTHTTPHASPVNGASQQAWAWTAACAPLQNEPAPDHKANWDGWVLVANPFPSGLNVDLFCTTNGLSSNDIRVWDRTGDPYQTTASPSYAYRAMNGKIIPPMQAFFVKSTLPTNSIDLRFLDAHRAFSAESILKTDSQNVTVIATNLADNTTNHAVLGFNMLATDNYDQGYDSYALSQSGNTTPQISFHHVYQSNGLNVVAPLYVNTVADNQPSGSYPLRFWSRTPGNFNFTLNQDALNPTWKVYVEDTKVAPGVSKEITKGSYSFSYATTDSPTRFILHFVNTVFSVDQNSISGWSAASWFSANNQLDITLSGSSLPKNASISVYNVTGQLLHVMKTAGQTAVSINNNFAGGMYMVHIVDENGITKVLKVVKGN